MCTTLKSQWFSQRAVKQLSRILILALSLNICFETVWFNFNLQAQTASPAAIAQRNSVVTQIHTDATSSGAPFLKTLQTVPASILIPVIINKPILSAYAPLATGVFLAAQSKIDQSFVPALAYLGSNGTLPSASKTPGLSNFIAANPILAPLVSPAAAVSADSTYPGLSIDSITTSGLLNKTAKYCTDLESLLGTKITWPSTSSQWQGATCVVGQDNQCCDNLVCVADNTLNLGSTPDGKAQYGVCDKPAVTTCSADTDCNTGNYCDLTTKLCVTGPNIPKGDGCTVLGADGGCVAGTTCQASPTAGQGNICQSCTITGNSCSVDLTTGANTCCTGFCVGGSCSDSCAAPDVGALGQSCCTDTSINLLTNAATCSTVVPCCVVDYSCDITNANLPAGAAANAGTKCCISGAASPGNQAIPCSINPTNSASGDSSCCTGSMCLKDPSSSNSYCVSCIANPSSYYTSLGETPPVCTTDSSGVQCCDDQQLNCVPVTPAAGGAPVNTCIACIGQSCPNGNSDCCAGITGLTCGTSNPNPPGTPTTNTCCMSTNANCQWDQDCCAGNNCVVNDTVTGSNSGKGVCTTCGSTVGATCSGTQPCCSSTPALSCVYAAAGDTTGTCQNSCTGNSDCNSGYYCDIAVGNTTGTCTACIGSTCTGIACGTHCNSDGDNYCDISSGTTGTCAECLGSVCTGTACAANCDTSNYMCSNGYCVTQSDPSNPPASPDASDGSGHSVWDWAGPLLGVGVAVGAYLWWRSGRGPTEFKFDIKTTGRAATGSTIKTAKTIKLNLSGTGASTDDQLALLTALKAIDESGLSTAYNAAKKAAGGKQQPTYEQVLENYKPSKQAKFSDAWKIVVQYKVSNIKSGKTITDLTTISILKGLSDAGLLRTDNEGDYEPITLKNSAGQSIDINFPSGSKAVIAAAIAKTPVIPGSPFTPVLQAATIIFMKNIISGTGANSFAQKSGGYTDLNDLLVNYAQANTDPMRTLWSAAYAELVANGNKSPQDTDIVTYLIEETNFSDLFTAGSQFKNSDSAVTWIQNNRVGASDYFVARFTANAPASCPTDSITQWKRVYDSLLTQAQESPFDATLKIACILAGKDYSNMTFFSQQDKADIAWNFERIVSPWAPEDYMNQDMWGFR